MTATSLHQKQSQSDSWEDLAPAENVTVLPPPSDEPPDTLPGKTPYCAVCQEEIIRAPGARGRAPKYHPDCRPSSNKSGSAGTGRAASNAKAEKESDEAVAAFKSLAVKACIMISMIDKYDAFCIMVSLPDISENLKGVLIRYPTFRKEMLALKGGGSVISLALLCVMTVAPMLAHHGLIPSKRIAQTLVQAPFTLHQIHQRMKEGEAALTKLMEEQLRKRTGSNDGDA